MERLGLHILIEYHQIDPYISTEAAQVEKIMLEASKKAGMHHLHHYFHQFSPQGVTGMIVVKESQLSIHTWPENRYAAVEIFTCGSREKLEEAMNYIGDALQADHWKVLFVERGGANWEDRQEKVYKRTTVS